jgi:glycyl-tRNA synthetase alpha subunit
MFEQTFKNIDDVLWKEAGCTTELNYTEQTFWILFLKYLDDLEQERSLEAELDGKSYEFILDKEHRWSSWAAPKANFVQTRHKYDKIKKLRGLMRYGSIFTLIYVKEY